MVRIGILGTARIAGAFTGRSYRNAQLAAVASRSLERARAFAAEHGIPRALGSYDELLADPSVDAVYVPLPQHLHCEWVVRAAEAGKHVLVEKPAALTSAEVAAMTAACERNRVAYMEAFMYRFMSVHRRSRELAAGGAVGELRGVDFRWCIDTGPRGVSKEGFRMRRELGGGGLLDLGVYGMDFLRLVTGGRPELLWATVRRRDGDGIDEFALGVYRWNEAVLTMGCGFAGDANYYAIAGDGGSILSPMAVAGRQTPRELHIHLFEGDRKWVETFPPENPYVAELEYFADCIANGTRPSPGPEDSLANLQMIEELLRAAEPGAPRAG